VLPYSRALLSRLAAAGVPTIHFGSGNPALLGALADAGGDAVGVDWRVGIDVAWNAIGADRAIQGNLDPASILAGEAAALEATREVLARAGGRVGHIFNVGHGLDPASDPAVVRAVVELVRSYRTDDAGCPPERASSRATASASAIRPAIPSRAR
jgi:uroporphyrinogen decarboxylase